MRGACKSSYVGGAYSLVRFFLDVEWRHRRRASFSGAADARAAVLSSQI